MSVRVEPGNCLEVMRKLAEEDVQVDAIVTDAPYHLQSIVKRFSQATEDDVYRNAELRKTFNQGASPYARAARGFMGKAWDGGDVAFNSVTWGTAGELLKPGGWLLAFGGTRTYHRLGWAIEGGGFEINDAICWHYGSGFPKSHNPLLAMRGLPRSTTRDQWRAWHRLVRQRCGTALKPATELIAVCRKPLSESTVARNMLKHGTGALNVDGCRVEGTKPQVTQGVNSNPTSFNVARERQVSGDPNEGRWPANVCHDGSPEVEEAFAAFGERSSGVLSPHHDAKPSENLAMSGGNYADRIKSTFGGDSGSASRFFYTAKADKHDRWGSKHPTVKPIDLMRWLVRLVTPPGGTVLDPFAGSGTTGIACIAEGFDCILIEREEEYLADIRERLAFYEGDGKHSLASKHRKSEAGHDDLPLFGGNSQ